MKLLRVGQKGKEIPAALDKDGKIRDVSQYVKDLSPDNLNFKTISKLQSVDLSLLSEIFTNTFPPSLLNDIELSSKFAIICSILFSIPLITY